MALPVRVVNCRTAVGECAGASRRRGEGEGEGEEDDDDDDDGEKEDHDDQGGFLHFPGTTFSRLNVAGFLVPISTAIGLFRSTWLGGCQRLDARTTAHRCPPATNPRVILTYYIRVDIIEMLEHLYDERV